MIKRFRAAAAILFFSTWANGAVTTQPIEQTRPAPAPRQAAKPGAAVPATQADAGKAHGFLWKVSSPTTTAYLLGSMHMAPKDLYPLAPEIEEAFKTSQILVVELDITKVDQTAMLTTVTENGMYTDGSTLEQHVSPATMKSLKDFAAQNKVPEALFSSMKPWMVGATLVELIASQQGFDASAGVDVHFLNAANSSNKQIVELESGEEQIKLLAGFDEKLQEKFLVSSIKESDHMKTDFAKLLATWKGGDAKAMNTLVMEDYDSDPSSKTLTDTLLFKRNISMAAKIEELLKGRKQIFVVVGAAHLVGDKGIVAILQKRHKVEQPPVTPRASQ